MMEAIVGLVGVIVGAVTSLVASVVVPWIRDTLDRRRIATETRAAERRLWLMAALSSLQQFRQAQGTPQARGTAQASFGSAYNELTVRLTSTEQPVLDVLLGMFVMIQRPIPGIEDTLGEAMLAVTLWERGDIATSDLIGEVEQRAQVKFSADRRSVSPA